MAKAAIVVLADSETHADLGRLTNALETAKEFHEEGDEVKLIFDGAGTTWIDELTDESHPSHAIYRSLTDVVEVCEYCAGAFHVEDAVEESAAEPVAEFEGHPSLRQLVVDGYEVITF